jgi:hypothetical protein
MFQLNTFSCELVVTGELAFIETLFVAVAPLLSVTVREAEYEPAEYVCVGFADEDVLPSPKFQK